MNRRDWLKTAGGLVVGFTFSGLPAFGEQTAPPARSRSDGRPLDPKEVDSFLSINPDGSVTVYTSKVDVGTGMRIAMAQMAAEELGVDTARITVVDGDTGAMSEHRRHGRQHRAHARRHRRSSGRGDRPPGAPRSRGDAAEASGRRPDHRRGRSAARWLAVAAYGIGALVGGRRLAAASRRARHRSSLRRDT